MSQTNGAPDRKPCAGRVKAGLIGNFLPLAFLVATVAVSVCQCNPHVKAHAVAHDMVGHGSSWQSDRSTSFTSVQALAYPVPGRKVAAWSAGSISIVQAINNCMVFLVSGLTLRTTELRDTLKRWQGVAYGLLAILLITPCLAFATVRIGFTPSEFAVCASAPAGHLDRCRTFLVHWQGGGAGRQLRMHYRGA